MATPEVLQPNTDNTSIFQSDLPIAEKLDRARTELLDLSARNRLLNMPRSSKSARAIEIVDERSSEIFRLLVRESKVFTFVAGKAADRVEDARPDEPEDDEITELAQPEDDLADERGVFNRHADTRLQTRLTPKGLQKRLLELYFDARTLEEEQGVNILYLTLGTLKWIDPGNAANIRFAPLLLIPIALERGNAGEKFKLRARPEDFASNLSLEAFLDRTQGIRLPAFEASDALDPIAYMNEIGDAVGAKSGWTVQHDDIALGFFSFAKFLMYRDLDAASWPASAKITERPLIRGLLADGFARADGMLSEDAKLDSFMSPADMLHIVDCDSSQALAVHEVRRGRDMVIQGPPGTGKSQTIANIVASAVADGKTVLFVAEKMAALEVVKRRLDATGVGDACLELHSNKANKRALLDELRRTWELGAPRGNNPASLHTRLTDTRDRLNRHAERMHAPHVSAGLTPFQVIGQLVRLKIDGEQPNDLVLEAAAEWSPDDYAARHDVLSELVERVLAIGRPVDHVWFGVGLVSVTPMEVERFASRSSAAAQQILAVEELQRTLAHWVEREPAPTLEAIESLIQLARRVVGAPALSGAALGSPEWVVSREAIKALLLDGICYDDIRTRLAGVINEHAWTTDVGPSLELLGRLPQSFSTEAFGQLSGLVGTISRLIAEAGALARSMGRESPATFTDIRRLIQIGERVAVAPDASPEAFAADLWDTGLDRASDLSDAVRMLEVAQADIGDSLLDAAWKTDLSAARATLASHGVGFLKIFSGEWRRANSLVRSVLKDPAQSLDSTLKQLDALSQGQRARAKIESEDSFGRSAFGTTWRGDRSGSAALIALVDWMQSLKGLGAEPRLVAANRPDRETIAMRGSRVAALLAEALPTVEMLWNELPQHELMFGDALNAERTEVAPFLANIEAFHTADRTTASLAVSVQQRLPDRLSDLNWLKQGQDCSAKLEAEDALGRSAFGEVWKGLESNWTILSQAAAWIDANADIRLLAARTGNHAGLDQHTTETEQASSTLCTDLNRLIDDLQFETQKGLGTTSAGTCPSEKLRARLDAWAASGEQLSKWVAYRDRSQQGRALGCDDVVSRLQDGRLAPAAVIPAFEIAYFEAIYANLVQADPDLGRFDGTLHGRIARDFTDLDRQRIAASSIEVVQAHHKRVPLRDTGAVGPLGVLRAEIQKKRGQMPIRRLMEKAGPAVQALKPVFMMSPLSVAQFLAPGAFEFDLLVMDEASQIQPVDALGAVARAKQVVVVGDPKQLPPTAFFSKMTGGASDDDDDGGRVADIESILGLFTARGLPMRMLRWHYRSKHQSLIAVSNRQFYENKLLIVPSPYTAEAGMGLRFHRVPQGLFDAGGTRTNQEEAKTVAQAIINHARDYPELSLGVAAFSVAQRRAIVDQLEMLRRTAPPETEAFFQAHHSEPFFVKNLENVQGDERDVVFISVGYGPTTLGGRVPMRFGPLGTEGGERRLNVLISRAKQRCEVFSSITDEDIDPDFAQSRKGVFAFRLFLHFARTGRMALTEGANRDDSSVFEDQITRVLQARGYQVHRQVGVAGIFIDLAIADAERPGRYLLGIECDGIAYRDARSARDRDRLRQSVLESHGWMIHRVWICDWFYRPSEQVDIIVQRIEAAKLEHDCQSLNSGARALDIKIEAVERENVTEIGIVHTGGEQPAENSYVEAVLKRPTHYDELHETPIGLLTWLVTEAVRVEGPVHIDEVVDRIRDAWGLKRAGGRIQQLVETAISLATSNCQIERHGAFLSTPKDPVKIRDRSLTKSSSLRRADRLPPAEINAAILQLININFGASREQVVLSVARKFGIKAVGAAVRSTLEAHLEALLKQDVLTEQAGIMTLKV